MNRLDLPELDKYDNDHYMVENIGPHSLDLVRAGRVMSA